MHIVSVCSYGFSLGGSHKASCLWQRFQTCGTAELLRIDHVLSVQCIFLLNHSVVERLPHPQYPRNEACFPGLQDFILFIYFPPFLVSLVAAAFIKFPSKEMPDFS